VLYRRDVWSPTSIRRISLVAAYLWLADSFQLFFLALLAALVSPAALVYALLGVLALVLVALLLTQQPSVPLFSASTIAGLVFTLAGIAAASQPGLVPIWLTVAFTATSVAETVVSATGARGAQRLR